MDAREFPFYPPRFAASLIPCFTFNRSKRATLFLKFFPSFFVSTFSARPNQQLHLHCSIDFLRKILIFLCIFYVRKENLSSAIWCLISSLFISLRAKYTYTSFLFLVFFCYFPSLYRQFRYSTTKNQTHFNLKRIEALEIIFPCTWKNGLIWNKKI